jgi:hypothetical protein
MAYLLMDTVYEPLRRWENKPEKTMGFSLREWIKSSLVSVLANPA